MPLMHQGTCQETFQYFKMQIPQNWTIQSYLLCLSNSRFQWNLQVEARMYLKLQDQREMIRDMLTNKSIDQYHMTEIANETENYLF